jgi:arginase
MRIGASWAVMTGQVTVIGVPTALGGHLGGMERSPVRLRDLGLVARLAAQDVDARDAGDLSIEPGFHPDTDPRAKNRDRIAEFLPREAAMVEASLDQAGPGGRVLIVGGDCTAHAGALAGLRRRHPDRRLALAWFDAHGDFNTPDTTPSGNVWGMPFAMACGIGDTTLVAACDGPTVDARDAALLGGQVLDEQESRMLVTVGVAHFGAGMLATPAGLAALSAWGAAKAAEVDGLYVAFDMDALDGAGRWAIQMPEPDGISLETALSAIAILAGTIEVAGFGASGVNLDNGDPERTLDAVARLAGAALA